MEKTYWTKVALEAQKQLQSQKIFDAKKHHFRHPKLSDLTFEKKEISLQNLTREERRKQFEQSRKERREKLNKLPYSELHNKLINKAYGKFVNSFKKSAIEAAHEAAIERIIIKKEIYNSMKEFAYDKDKPNLLIINTEYNWNIKQFMLIPSSHNMDTLRRIGIDMAEKLSVSMKNFFNIEIWEKSEYMSKLAGGRGNYRYEISRSKPVA